MTELEHLQKALDAARAELAEANAHWTKYANDANEEAAKQTRRAEAAGRALAEIAPTLKQHIAMRADNDVLPRELTFATLPVFVTAMQSHCESESRAVGRLIAERDAAEGNLVPLTHRAEDAEEDNRALEARLAAAEKALAEERAKRPEQRDSEGWVRVNRLVEERDAALKEAKSGYATAQMHCDNALERAAENKDLRSALHAAEAKLKEVERELGDLRIAASMEPMRVAEAVGGGEKERDERFTEAEVREAMALALHAQIGRGVPMDHGAILERIKKGRAK